MVGQDAHLQRDMFAGVTSSSRSPFDRQALLNGLTPAAALEKLLLNPPKPSVATTL
jgi:hypothetical protein